MTTDSALVDILDKSPEGRRNIWIRVASTRLVCESTPHEYRILTVGVHGSRAIAIATGTALLGGCLIPPAHHLPVPFGVTAA